MAQKRFTLLASVLIAAGVLLGSAIFFLGSSATTDTNLAEPTLKPSVPISGPEKSSTEKLGDLPPLPPELEGLEPQTDFKTDENGNLIPGHELRVLFDFFLANVDREPLDTVLQRIRTTLESQLTEPAKSQAFSLLERYVGYRMSIEELQERQSDGVTLNGFDLETLEERQQALASLRREHFARPEIEAFFGEDAELDNYTLARIRIQKDPSLTEVEKQRRFQQLDHQLPQPVRVARKRAVIHGEIYQKAQQLKSVGASEAELYNLRATELGEEAATKLARLDREQNQWQSRLSHYRQERARIIEAGLSEADRNTAIENLRDNLFSGPERLRVRALDADQG